MMSRIIYFLGKLFFLIFIPVSLICNDDVYEPNEPYTPYFVGSLLPFTATNMDKGKSTFNPYVVFLNTYGKYDSFTKVKGESNVWAINSFVEYLYGITDRIGFEAYISCIANFRKGENATYFQDTQLILGFQIANDTANSWIPDCRIDLELLVPTGSYQKLDPQKMGIDSTGGGSFQTGFNFVVQKQFPTKHHFFRLKWNIEYLFPAPVNVKDLNTYGGGAGTKGTVYPGQQLGLFFATEYSWSQKLAYACDFYFTRIGSAHFSGKRGKSLDGSFQKVGLPYSYQLSLAPQLEYSFSKNMGLVTGIWASIIGKNSPAFFATFFSFFVAF